MKNITRTLWMSALAMAFLVSSCSDDESEPNNQLSVNGKAYKFNKANVEISTDEDEEGVFFEHSVVLTGKGLSFLENGNLSGVGPLAAITFESDDEELEPGTYTIGISTERPHAVEFVLIPSIDTEEGFDKIHFGYGGTIKVSKSGEKYTLKVDLNVYSTATDESDEEFGAGKIKGNYKGEIVVVIDEETIGRRKQQLDFSKYKSLVQ